MTDILIRGVDEAILERLKQRAAANGRSLQQELKEIIRLASGMDAIAALALADKIRERIKKKYPVQTDSVDLIREDRDR